MEAVDGDDEIGGYGIAGGVDGGLFAVVEETGELMLQAGAGLRGSFRCGERGTGKRSSRQRIHCSGRGKER